MPPVTEIIIAAAMIVGTFFVAVASIGLLRLPDVFCRMHAASKAGTLGVSLLILGPVLFFFTSEWGMALRGLLAIGFQFLTTPAATHLLSRAAYVTDYPLTERTAVDELEQFLDSVPDEVVGQE